MGFYRYLLVIWSVITILTVVNASVNIARGKATDQSSVYGRWRSYKAVDGCVNTYMNSFCCILTGLRQTEAWWQVDLQTQSVIDTVNIIYRDEGTLNRLAGYEMYLSNIPDWTSGNRCYKDTTADLASMSSTQNVTCSGVARYLTIYNDRRVKTKTWYSDAAFLELCEVQVNGCQVDKYGNGNCDKDCINCLGNICHPASGTYDDCAAGYHTVGGSCIPCPANCEGSKCDSISGACLECNDGFYGSSCSQTCPVNCNVCNKDNGLCIDCNDGYYGLDCTPCPRGCSTNTCDKTSGSCVHCNDGYYGLDCTPCPRGCSTNTCDKTSGSCVQCNDGLYGSFCSQSCPANCKHNVCTKDNGHCNDCNDGYYGPACTPCPSDCSTKTCDKTSGHCFHCNDGYYGPACTPCPSGCSTKTCDKTSGHCVQCDTGFYGSFCRKPCSVNCKNNVCNKDNGLCIECDDGLHGSVCRQPCPANCKHNVCTKDHGHCKECDIGFYGNCNLPCPVPCKNNVCNKDNGQCTVVIVMDKDAAVGVGVGSGVLVLALVVVIIALVRRLTMKRGDTTKSTHMTDISSSRTANELNIDQDDHNEDIATHKQEQSIVQISDTETANVDRKT